MKSRWSICKLGLALFFTSAAVLVTATPLSTVAHGLDANLDLYGRATQDTGKYVGSACNSSDECYSKNCVDVSGSKKGKKTCQRQPVGGPCFKDANCLTRNCNLSTKSCITPSKLNGTCSVDSDCASGYTCDSNKCKVPVGSHCTKSSDCTARNSCNSGVCSFTLLGPNRPCDQDSECISGGCSLPFYCAQDDGAYTLCDRSVGYTGSGVCDRYPAGHTCVHPGDCRQGQCKGTCTNSTVGDSCKSNFQCTNGQLCSGGVCTVYADRSQLPGVDCSADIQCMSNECSRHWSQEPSNGLWTHYGDFKRDFTPSDQPYCAPIPNGGRKCRTYADCATGLCFNGTCKEGSAGDRCVANAQCKDDLVCSLNGVCHAPTKKQGKFEPCKNGEQCLSTLCSNRATRQTSRPSLDGIGGGSQVSVDFESVCAASSFNGGCTQQSDCGQGVCNSKGVCVGKARGDSCTDPSQCTSLSCTIPDGQNAGTCTLGAAYAACETNADCYSNSCGTGDCYFFNPTICPRLHCQLVNEGDQCRTGADCTPFGACYESKCVGFIG